MIKLIVPLIFLFGCVSEKPKSEVSQYEVLAEIYRIVLNREIEDAEFATAVALKESGASLEGIHNGLVHSSVYARLENEFPADERSLSRFLKLLYDVELNLSEPLDFDESSARPISISTVEELQFGKPPEVVSIPLKNKGAWMLYYDKIFKTASPFTLKRVLSLEILRLVEELEAKNRFSSWFASFAVQTAGLGVDFGLELRHSKNRIFHETWAKSASTDMRRWEVLNRVHRLLNPKKKENLEQ